VSETPQSQVVVRRASRIQVEPLSLEPGGPQPSCQMELSYNATVGQLSAQCVGECPGGGSCQLVEEPIGSGNFICRCV
jgi:hypothetical protein